MHAVKISNKSASILFSTLLKGQYRYFRLNILMILMFSGGCGAASFNPAFLENNDGNVADLEQFSSEEGQLPGKYVVDIYVNNESVDHREVNFISNKSVGSADKTDNPTGLLPCFTLEELKGYGLKTDSIKGFLSANTANKNADSKTPDDVAPPDGHDATCSTLLQSIPGAKAEFDFNQQRLNISIPQALFSAQVRGYVDPSKWDEGIPAFISDYNFTGANGETKGSGNSSKDSSYYLNLRTGLNYGAWRLRNYSTWNDNNGVREWNNINTYLQRTIVPLKSLLTLGDGYSPSDVFDSSQFRGFQLASDDNMLPDSQQGFAPIIRGIAKTNAQVTIAQNGYTIYQSYVTPGPFEINDLFPSGGSGDLTVTIKEEDGSQQIFVQPYASVPMLQREGRIKYSLTGGQYRNGYGSSTPPFGQFTIIRGFSKGITAYTGVQASSNYSSLALGLGKNLGDFGAVSIDITQSKTTLPDDVNAQGQSYRFLYSKSFAGSGTDFRLLGYRYSTSGFYTLQESVDLNEQENTLAIFDIKTHKRSRIEGSINQSLPDDFGSFYFSASVQNYWGDDSKEQTLQWGYSNNWNGISYNLAVSDNYVTSESRDRQISLNVSVPLDRWLKSSYVSYNMTHSSDGQVQHQTSLSGTLLDDNNLNYNVSQGFGNQGQGNTGSTSLDYQGRYGDTNAGYSYSKDSKRLNYGIKGGIIGHSGGITLSQPLGETVVLVATPGASGTKISNNNGVKTDVFGYAVLPYITPYRHNVVALDTTSLSKNVEIEESATDVVPTRGAVVRARFKTHVGFRVIMTLTQSSGKFVPFGTIISLINESGNADAGIVGEAGEAYLSGLPPKGTLIAQWGKEPEKQCKINYTINSDDSGDGLLTLDEKCVSNAQG